MHNNKVVNKIKKLMKNNNDNFVLVVMKNNDSKAEKNDKETKSTPIDIPKPKTKRKVNDKLLQINKLAKEIKEKNKNKKWVDCIKQASKEIKEKSK